MSTVFKNETMIKMVVEKAINRLQDNPKREIRNLVDLASTFSTGKFQKKYLELAEKQLKNEDSNYYKLITNIINETDSNNLLSFGMNLCYHSFTIGANKIRQIEGVNKYNVPWVLSIDLFNNGLFKLTDLTNTILQGKELGIYSYILHLDAAYLEFDKLIKVIKEESDCAFLIISDPENIILNKDLITCKNLKNVAFCINIKYFDTTKIERATSILKDSKLLHSAFYSIEDNEILDYKVVSELCNKYHYSIVITSHSYNQYIQDETAIAKELYDIRNNLDLPIVPFDLMSDVILADRNISTEGCLARISSNGLFNLSDMENHTHNSDYNILDTSLSEILKHTVPKTS